MFSVIFKTHPKSGQWDAYLGTAKMLRPELEQVEVFIDNFRYRSLTRADGLISWDVFDPVLTPGDLMLMLSRRDQAAAETFEAAIKLPGDARLRQVRDYGMFDRREAPQYYPEAARHQYKHPHRRGGAAAP